MLLFVFKSVDQNTRNAKLRKMVSFTPLYIFFANNWYIAGYNLVVFHNYPDTTNCSQCTKNVVLPQTISQKQNQTITVISNHSQTNFTQQSCAFSEISSSNFAHFLWLTTQCIQNQVCWRKIRNIYSFLSFSFPSQLVVPYDKVCITIIYLGKMGCFVTL